MIWQHIETAPKTQDGVSGRWYGPRILACRPGGPVDIWRWHHQPDNKHPRPFWRRTVPHGATVDREQQPTLWMPLPEAPPAQGEEAKP